MTTEEERVVGFWVSSDRKELVFNPEQSGPQLALPLALLTELEVSRGQKSQVGKGARIGGVVGAVIGGVVGTLSVGLCKFLREDQRPDINTLSCWLNIPIGVGLVGAVGAGVGAGIGAASGPADRWETVPLDRIRVSLTPTTLHGFGATLRLSFSP